MSIWLAIQIEGDDLDNKLALLFEFGISGTSLEPDGSAVCYYQSESQVISEELSNQIISLNLSVLKIEEIKETNWTQNCEDLFQQVQVGSLRIIPIRTSEQEIDFEVDHEKDLLIIPGTGFGTGHHPTTFNLLKLLQDSRIKTSAPKTILDAGAGSGILAIGACLLYGSKIDAYEIDQMALDNAKENIEINKLSSRIELFCESVQNCEATYDLIVANLYAELLENFCVHLIDRGNANSYFLLSGIRAELAQSVINKFSLHGLECLEKVVSDGWAALMLKRV